MSIQHGHGLKPVHSQTGEGYSGNLSRFPLDTDHTDPIFVGDPVSMVDGKIRRPNGTPYAGVFMGWEGVEVPAKKVAPRYWPGRWGGLDPTIQAEAVIAIPSLMTYTGTVFASPEAPVSKSILRGPADFSDLSAVDRGSTRTGQSQLWIAPGGDETSALFITGVFDHGDIDESDDQIMEPVQVSVTMRVQALTAQEADMVI